CGVHAGLAVDLHAGQVKQLDRRSKSSLGGKPNSSCPLYSRVWMEHERNIGQQLATALDYSPNRKTPWELRCCCWLKSTAVRRGSPDPAEAGSSVAGDTVSPASAPKRPSVLRGDMVRRPCHNRVRRRLCIMQKKNPS